MLNPWEAPGRSVFLTPVTRLLLLYIRRWNRVPDPRSGTSAVEPGVTVPPCGRLVF
jgi:hypothetical protein